MASKKASKPKAGGPKPTASAAGSPPPRLIDEWLTRLAKIFGLITSIVAAGLLLFAFFGNSKTSVAFFSADDNVIFVHLSNRGPKQSTLRGYRLSFPDLPIDPAPLQLIQADGKKAYVPRMTVDLKNSSIDAGSQDIGLIVPGLNVRMEPGTEEVFESKLKDGHATLEIDVQEAKDPDRGPWHTRSDTFPAERIHFIIMKKSWFGGG